jgi:hypothetical protein
MDHQALIGRLELNATRLRTLLEGVTPEEARWKPSPDRWSILEVACHLLDEEREDFRPRIDALLREPGASGPPISPAGWVTERRYNERDLAETLASFVDERAKSLAWLRGLKSPSWENRLEHRTLGVIRAGDFLAAWTSHDLLHIRQLARLHYDRVRELARPYGVGYAGDW